MDESVRTATPADLATVVALVDAFVEEQRTLRGGEVWATLEAPRLRADELSLMLADANAPSARHFALLGCLDGHVVGLALGTLVAPAVGDPIARLDALYVDPEAREVGVGSALLDATLDTARIAGCAGVDATVLPGNRNAKNFFEMHGLVARAISVFRAVGEGS